MLPLLQIIVHFLPKKRVIVRLRAAMLINKLKFFVIFNNLERVDFEIIKITIRTLQILKTLIQNILQCHKYQIYRLHPTCDSQYLATVLGLNRFIVFNTQRIYNKKEQLKFPKA
jgi:hypothetical protein